MSASGTKIGSSKRVSVCCLEVCAVFKQCRSSNKAAWTTSISPATWSQSGFSRLIQMSVPSMCSTYRSRKAEATPSTKTSRYGVAEQQREPSGDERFMSSCLK